MNASEYEKILVAAIKNVPHMKLAEMLARLRLEPAHQRLSRLGEQASLPMPRMHEIEPRLLIVPNARTGGERRSD